MFRRASLVNLVLATSTACVSCPVLARRWVVNYPTPSPSDAQHSVHSPRERNLQRERKGLDVNRLSYLPEAAKIPQQSDWTIPIDHIGCNLDEAKKVIVNHKLPEDNVDKLALMMVGASRLGFDLLAGFKFGRITEVKFVNRIVFLETVAGVPGMVAGMLRHMTSLRKMERDHGWIHTLLEEAENERMHLLTFLEMKKPSFFFRCCVLVTQGIFFNMFFLAYLISPRFCHRLVGYIEEEAVKTYTHLLELIDAGELPMFSLAKCPPLAVNYWKLGKDATFRDLIVAIRADEAGHRLVNHTFADMHANNLHHGTNPFIKDHVNVMNEEYKKKPPEENDSELDSEENVKDIAA